MMLRVIELRSLASLQVGGKGLEGSATIAADETDKVLGVESPMMFVAMTLAMT